MKFLHRNKLEDKKLIIFFQNLHFLSNFIRFLQIVATKMDNDVKLSNLFINFQMLINHFDNATGIR